MTQALIGRVSGGENLSMDEMREIVDAIMQGKCGEEEIGVFLTALRAKGETIDEVAGAAAAMRMHMTPIRTQRQGVLDTCGTGGDASGTFNISTAAALVAAASGVPVAKHGNRSITSKTGSSEVLAALGVNVEAPVEIVEKCLDELGVCFCFAPLLHASMKHVAAVRRKLGFPTIFNMLGPLCNPASAPFQLLGVGKPHLRELLSAALVKLGVQRAVVVCGEDGLDEVTLSGKTFATEIRGQEMNQIVWSPSDFGLSEADKSSMQAEDPESSAKIIREILGGAAGPARDIVVINAAAALWVAGKNDSLKQCAQAASLAIDSGGAGDLLIRLAEVSHS